MVTLNQENRLLVLGSGLILEILEIYSITNKVTLFAGIIYKMFFR